MDLAFNLVNKGLTESIKARAAKNTGAPQKGPDYAEISRKIHEDTKKAKTEIASLDRSI